MSGAGRRVYQIPRAFLNLTQTQKDHITAYRRLWRITRRTSVKHWQAREAPVFDPSWNLYYESSKEAAYLSRLRQRVAGLARAQQAEDVRRGDAPGGSLWRDAVAAPAGDKAPPGGRFDQRGILEGSREITDQYHGGSSE
ncbi:unnamed protein product [Pedinophyceae sp. YPF-701]|nr:unnamed protein product [Pedinophyceae sp. YPF-701]